MKIFVSYHYTRSACPPKRDGIRESRELIDSSGFGNCIVGGDAITTNMELNRIEASIKAQDPTFTDVVVISFQNL